MKMLKDLALGEPDNYDRTTVVLHWVTAALVLLLWGSAQVIDYFAKGPPRWNMLGLHMALGVLLALVLGYRIAWRLSSGRRLPESGGAAYRWLVRSTHFGLYALVVIQVLLGFANAWVRGDHVFTWFVIPAFDPANKPLRERVGDLHELGANLILVVAGLHAAVGLFHHYVMRDGILRRMRFRP